MAQLQTPALEWIFSKCCSPEQQILLPDLCLDQDRLGGRVTSTSQDKTDLGQIEIPESN